MDGVNQICPGCGRIDSDPAELCPRCLATFRRLCFELTYLARALEEAAEAELHGVPPAPSLAPLHAD